MRETTVGQLLVNNALPPELRDYNRVIDGKSIASLFQQLAERHRDNPRVYSDVARKLSDIGRETAYRSAGFSFGLQHLQQAPAIKQMLEDLRQKLDDLDNTPGDEADKERQMLSAVDALRTPLEKAVYKDALDTHNPLALQIISKARGNETNLRSLLGADLLYVDAKGRTVPIPVLHSFSEGLPPDEYWAGTYGARKSVIDTKLATADAGYFSKQLTQAAHRLVVTDEDDPDNPDDESRGLPVDTFDEHNVGALLARKMGPYNRNTVLTPRILKDLENRGFDQILVRSPLVGGPADGGVYARDAGVREKAGLPPRGDFVGIAGAQAIGDRVSQGSLNSKHGGGVAGAAANRAVGGFALLNQLVQVPKTFRGSATHAEVDGIVQRIEEAPQGGQYVYVENKSHYVPHEAALKVKAGDRVEAGDVMSDGIPNPAKIVEHKGIGEGRRYFTHAFRNAMRDANLSVERRNIELVARGLINHVKLTDELGDYVPDDIVSYQSLEKNWRPRPETAYLSPSSAVGKYLEQPVLHYTIGTRIKDSMLPTLQKFGINQLPVHANPPPFTPLMVPARDNLSYDPDPISAQLGSGLKKTILNSAHRGRVSDTTGTSYVPALAAGLNFGEPTDVAAPSFNPR